MNRRVIIGIIVLVSLVLLVPSAAVTLQDSGTDSIDSTIHLSPSEGPNGKYALVNDETGELELHFGPSNPNLEGRGLNIDSTTPFHRVFTVTNNGSTSGVVWFTIEQEAVRFYKGTDPGASMMGEGSAVELRPNETIAVGVLVDATRDNVESVETFTIHAEPLDDRADAGEGTDGDPDDVRLTTTTSPDPQPAVTVTTPSDDERSLTFRNPTAGESMTADLDRLVLDTQVGDLVLAELAITPATDEDLELDARVVDPETGGLEDTPGLRPLGAARIDLRSGEVQNGTLSFTVDHTYLEATGLTSDRLLVYRTADETAERLRITDLDHLDEFDSFEARTARFQTITVVARVPEFEVRDAVLGNDSITAGEDVSVTATVSNEGLASGETEIAVTLDGREVATESLTLDPNDTTTVDVPIRPEEAGQFEVAVNGIPAGTLRVTSVSAPSGTATGDADSQVGTTTQPAEQTGTTDEPDGEADALDTLTQTVGEPAGFDVRDVGGVGLLLAILLVLVGLVRRKVGQ